MMLSFCTCVSSKYFIGSGCYGREIVVILIAMLLEEVSLMSSSDDVKNWISKSVMRINCSHDHFKRWFSFYLPERFLLFCCAIEVFVGMLGVFFDEIYIFHPRFSEWNHVCWRRVVMHTEAPKISRRKGQTRPGSVVQQQKVAPESRSVDNDTCLRSLRLFLG